MSRRLLRPPRLHPPSLAVLMKVGVNELKIWVMGLLFLMALVSCALPWMVSRYMKNTVVVFSVMNCLSGGVVLGAALSHMIPSATQNFIDYFANKENSPFKDYPLTPAICAVGLLLLLTIDRTLLSGAHSHSEVREYGSHTNSKKHSSHKYNTTHGTASQHYLTPDTPSLSHQHGSQKHLTSDTSSLPHQHGSQKYNATLPSQTLSSSTYQQQQQYVASSTHQQHHHQHGSQKYHRDLYTPSISNSATTSTTVIPIYATQSPSPNEPLLPEPATPRIDVGFNTDTLNRSISDYNSENKSAVAKTWVFLLALSVHSVLEGLGMGAENEETAFFSVLFAVLAHKCLEAFALGLSIFYARFNRTVTILMILGYSVATPLGVAAGMVTAQLSNDQNLMAGILVSLASGSFLYISLIEILPTELHKPRAIALKLVAMIFGWFAMVVLAFYA